MNRWPEAQETEDLLITGLRTLNNPAGAFCWRGVPYIVLSIVLSVFLRRAASLRRAAQLAGVTVAACVTLTAFAGPGLAPPVPQGAGPIRFTVTPPPGVAAPGGPIPKSLHVPGSAGAPPRQLFVPDLIAATPTGITSAQLARIGKLTGVRAVLPIDGGKVTVNGRSADMLGVSPQSVPVLDPAGDRGGERGLG